MRNQERKRRALSSVYQHNFKSGVQRARHVSTYAVAALLLATFGVGVNGAAAKDNILSVGLEADPTCLDGRQVGFTYALDLTRQVVDSLTDQNPTTGEILPWLAESWEGNTTANEFTFTLKPGFTFSDGSAVNAEAVVANFDDLKKQSYGTSFIRDLTK